MGPLSAIMYREAKIRATNLTFIFWDLFYPLGYLLVFGVGMTQAMGLTVAGYEGERSELGELRRARHHVGVTHPRAGDAHQDFTRARTRQLEALE